MVVVVPGLLVGMLAGVSVVEVAEEEEDDDGESDAADYDDYNLEDGWSA